MNPYKAPYQITQPFGPTSYASEPAYTFQGRYYPNFHLGIDLVGPSAHCPIYAITTGTVFGCGTDTDGANYVIVQSTGTFVAYWHLSAITVSRGQSVAVGDQLGNQGSTGNSSGNHLHLQIMLANQYGRGLNSTGTPTDPLPYITDAQGGNDMDVKEVVRGIRRVTNPTNNVSDDVINGDAGRIMAEGKIDGVLTDNLTSVPWRTPEQADMYALEAYASADGIADPEGFAVAKVQGKASPLQVFTEVLATLKGWSATKDRTIADLQETLVKLQQPSPQDGQLEDLQQHNAILLKQIDDDKAAIVELQRQSVVTTQKVDTRTGIELIRDGIIKIFGGS